MQINFINIQDEQEWDQNWDEDYEDYLDYIDWLEQSYD